MNTVSLLHQDSGEVEYYTDRAIIEAARRTMGGIDLDPASSPIANRIVRAATFFSLADSQSATHTMGHTLERPWGTVQKPNCVWMNHPFSRQGNPHWIRKLIAEYEAGHVSQACCITFAATSEQWFRPLYQGAMCFLSPRTNYYLPNGKKKRGVTKGSVVTYFGPEDRRAFFLREFAPLGEFPNVFA